MKVVHEDAKLELLRLRPESLDDLWHLSHLVEAGDVASALTHREPDEARAGSGGEKVPKRAMVLGVRVETVEFHEFSNRLRISGPIVEGPQDLGMYHTLNVEPFVEVTVRKGGRGWRDHHVRRVREAVEAARRPLVVILAIEENEAVVAVVRQFGVQRAAEVFGHASGKRHAPAKGAEEEFFDEVLLALREARPEGAPLVVVGPGFAKERFLRFARERQPDRVQGAVVEATGQAGMTGVHEALKRGVVERAQKGDRVTLETALVERVLERIATGGAVAYGLAETRAALDVGAVDTLLVTDEALRAGADVLMDRAASTGAAAVVVSTRHEAGFKLRALGGLAALLRFEIAR